MNVTKTLPLIGAIATFAIAGTAFAASTLFGAATMSGGTVTLVSNTADATSSNDYSGISFSDATGQALSSLSTLSADTMATVGGFGGGSPRFSIALDTTGDNAADGNVFVYLGTAPNFNDGVSAVMSSTGNLLTSSDARFDLTQFGGPFYGTYTDMINLLGTSTIEGIDLVVDGGWAVGGNQTIVVDNVSVNGNTYTFDQPTGPVTTNDCKNGGWMTFTNPTFKNQGECVSSVVNHSKNR